MNAMDIRQLQGMQLDEYELVDIIGKGGMSAVYRAYQEELDRHVAVKILATTLAAEPGYTRRFTNEAKMAASLEHPHIVPVYDFGVVDDLSYVVMRLLNGGTLKDRLDSNHALPASAVMQLVDAMAKALDYAHTRGIIHRDVKPGNIMFDEQGTGYLVDFGIARAAQYADAQLTAENTVLGTPAYMAPEQWRNETVSPATDQYALAVVVYWMLTGTLPFTGDTSSQLMYQHLNEAPPPAHEINDKLPPEVAAVLGRALAKDPADRYPGMTNFSNALRRALQSLSTATAQNLSPVRSGNRAAADPTLPHEGNTIENAGNPPQPEPVPPAEYEQQAAMPPRARPRPAPQDAPPPGQQTMMRQVATGGAIGLALLVILLIIGGVILFNLILPDAPASSPPQSTTVPTPAAGNPSPQPTDIILTPRTTARPGTGNGDNASGSGALNPQMLQQSEILFQNIEIPIRDVAYSPDGRFIAAADGEGRIQFWRDSVRSSWEAHPPVVSALAFNADGSQLVSGGRDNRAIIWDTASSSAIVTMTGHTNNVRDVAFSPDGSRVATASEDGTVRLWDAATGSVQQVISADPGRVLSVAFHPDGERIATGGSDSTVRLYAVSNGTQLARLTGHSEEIRSVAFSPDGRTLASASTDNTVRLWDVEAQSLRQTLIAHNNDVFVVTFSKDSATVVSGGRSGTIRLWDNPGGSLLNTLDAHNGWVLGLDVRPDNTALLSGGGDGAVRIWTSR